MRFGQSLGENRNSDCFQLGVFSPGVIKMEKSNCPQFSCWRKGGRKRGEYIIYEFETKERCERFEFKDVIKFRIEKLKKFKIQNIDFNPK